MIKFLKPFEFVGCVVIGEKARVSFLMIEEESPFFDRGVEKEKKVQGYVITYVFNKRDWNILRIRYNIILKAPLTSSAFIAVGALIAAATPTPTTAPIETAPIATPTPTPVATSTPATAPIETAPIATPTPPTITPSPPPTPMCYIVCTCGKPDCRLKQNQLRQQHNPSSAKVHKPVFKK